MAMDSPQPEEIADIYEELIDTYELEWQREGHKSLHLGYYDDDHEEPGPAAMNTMRVLSEAAGIEGDHRVLNIGCGVGEDSIWNALAFGATVIGLNISETQLEMARENAANHGVTDLTEFRFDDFHEMDTVETDSIDVVWGLEALSHSADKGRVLDQARRVLVPGGRIALTDLFVPAGVSPENEEWIRRVNENLGLSLDGIDDFEAALDERGFGNVRIRDLTDGIERSTTRRYKFARLAHPLGRVLGVFGLFSKTQLGAFKASADLHRLVTNGSLGYYLVTADAPEQVDSSEADELE